MVVKEGDDALIQCMPTASEKIPNAHGRTGQVSYPKWLFISSNDLTVGYSRKYPWKHPLSNWYADDVLK